MISANLLTQISAGPCTGKLVGSGLRFRLDEPDGSEGAHLIVSFTKGEREVVVEFDEHVDYKKLRFAREEDKYLPDLVDDGRMVLRGPKLWAFCNLPVGLVIPPLGKVTNRRDRKEGHQYLTLQALGASPADLPWLSGLGDDPFSTLARFNAYQDSPPMEANYLAILFGFFSTSEQTAHHSLATYYPQSGKPLIHSADETRNVVRSRVENHLVALHKIRENFNPAEKEKFNPGSAFRSVASRIDKMDANNPLETMKIIMDLKDELAWGNMKSIDWDQARDRVPEKEYVQVLMESYLAVREFMRIAEDSKAPLKDRIEAYAIVAQSFPEAAWNNLGTGGVALAGEGLARFGKLFHLVQDSVAHCYDWSGEDVGAYCEGWVSSTIVGVGEPHKGTTDSLEPEYGGEIKKTRAVGISKEVFELAQISDENKFNDQLETFLNDWYPDSHEMKYQDRLVTW